MNVADIVQRSDIVLKKYEKYLVEKDTKKEHKSQDPFLDEYANLLERVNELNLKADEISNEKNRALKATLNAELRRAKGVLLEEVPKLEKLMKKGKHVTAEVMDDRAAKVKQIREAIDGIPDGVHGPRKPIKPGSGLSPTKGKNVVNLAVTNVDSRAFTNENHYKHSAETSAFRQEYELAAKKQDMALDNIEKGLSTLKGIGEAMGETLQTQDVLLDEIDTKMDKVTKELRTNNMKLKGLVTQMRSSRNFCIDLTLICIILGIALYIYNVVQKK
ncbi:hypothetical protein WJX72_005237 [[Myrmecia] bisecta]|uniref:t-SNARE coiled-coil homology domain-containing protein n=1 Tax=[Myrmecia] bisecta TaxID=41462 RepID=A0AAW1R5R3_9CHLO